MERLMNQKGDPATKTVSLAMYDRNLVSICDKDLLKELLVVKGNNFIKEVKLYEVFNTFGGNILSALDAGGESWKNHHRVASGAFASKNLEYMAGIASDSVDLIRTHKWEKEMKSALESGKKGFVFDSNGDYSDMTLDVLGKAGFGLDFSIFDEKNDEGRIFRRALEKMFTLGVITKRFIGMNPAFSWAFPFVSKVTGVNDAVKIVSDKLDQIISERTKEVELKGVEEISTGSDERKDLLRYLKLFRYHIHQ